MKIILYCPSDEPWIKAIHSLFTHLRGCPNCEAFARSKGEAESRYLFSLLQGITTDDIPVFDWDAAIAFCDYWLDRHDMLSGIDNMLTAVPVNGRN
jgi:hypothetical protein